VCLSAGRRQFGRRSWGCALPAQALAGRLRIGVIGDRCGGRASVASACWPLRRRSQESHALVPTRCRADLYTVGEGGAGGQALLHRGG
jgi:hypothetical protein